MMAWSAEEIEAAFEGAELDGLPKNSSERFQLYLDLLLRWNQRINLTAIRTPEEIVRRHFIESVFTAQHLPEGITNLLDFGSGAGFPGIPIAICRPEIRVTLAESQLKKAAFLEEVLRSLGIAGEVFARRVEVMSQERDFDVVVMRAVDKMTQALVAARARANRFLVLLTTEQAAGIYQSEAPDFIWQKPLSLPGAKQAVLLLGSRGV